VRRSRADVDPTVILGTASKISTQRPCGPVALAAGYGSVRFELGVLIYVGLQVVGTLLFCRKHFQCPARALWMPLPSARR
jgi:hypothetical protein